MLMWLHVECGHENETDKFMMKLWEIILKVCVYDVDIFSFLKD